MSNKELETFRRRMVNAIVANDNLSARIISTQLIEAGYSLQDFKKYVTMFEREFELAQELRNRELEADASESEVFDE